MSSILDLIKPSEHIEELQDKEVVKRKYKYWRIRIFYAMYIGYVFYYFSRKSLAFAMPMMIKELGFDKSQLGLLGSILALSYGLSKFVSGILSDKSNPRFFMAFGLIITGILNVFFGLSSSIFSLLSSGDSMAGFKDSDGLLVLDFFPTGTPNLKGELGGVFGVRLIT